MGEHLWKRGKSDKALVNVYGCQGCGRSLKIRLNPDGSAFDPIEAVVRYLKYPAACPRPVPTPKELKALWGLARQWVTENQVRAPESIYQMDSVNLACPFLAEGVVGLVGYYEDPE